MATNGERFVKGEDEIIKRHWGTIPDWRGMMYEITKEGYDRTLKQIQRRAFTMQKQRKLKARHTGHHVGKPVRCIETGEVFISMSEATKAFRRGVRGSTAIRYAVIGRQKKAYGYHWEFVSPKTANEKWMKHGDSIL